MSKNCQDACAVLETKEECISRQKSEIVAPRTGSAECTGNMFTREVTFDDLFREKFIPLDSRKKVGNYVIGRVIGEGTFSKVREARNITNSEKRAVKVLPKKTISKRPDVRRRFMREVKSLRKICHKNIVQIHEVMETAGNYYIVMELLRGDNLKEYLDKRKRLSEGEAKHFMHQTIEAVDYMHSQGIVHSCRNKNEWYCDDFMVSMAQATVKDTAFDGIYDWFKRAKRIADMKISMIKRALHFQHIWRKCKIILTRDLKPENIILNGDVVKIIDFGLCACINQDETMSTQCGSPAYASPEIFNKEPYTKQVDVWSIGIILFLVVTGCMPFSVAGKSSAQVYATVLNGYELPKSLQLSTDCEDLISKMLVINADDRISTSDILRHKWFHKKPKEAR